MESPESLPTPTRPPNWPSYAAGTQQRRAGRSDGVSSPLQSLRRLPLWRVGALAAAAVIAVVVAAIALGGGSDEGNRPTAGGSAPPSVVAGGAIISTIAPRPSTAGVAASPIATATTAPSASNRRDCAAIRGTDYRSEEERQWFNANCTGVTPTAAAATATRTATAIPR